MDSAACRAVAAFNFLSEGLALTIYLASISNPVSTQKVVNVNGITWAKLSYPHCSTSNATQPKMLSNSLLPLYLGDLRQQRIASSCFAFF
eukprot:1672283-Ditylum_brightwellii.AAC.1